MKKLFNYIFVISVIIFSLLQIIILFSFNTDYYHNQNQKLKLYEKVNMSEEDVNLVFDDMFAYLDGKHDDLTAQKYLIDGSEHSFFNTREVLHMRDVKNLFRLAINIRNICAVIVIASLLFFKKFDFKIMFKAFKESLFLILCFVAAVGIYAMVDFTSFWTSFHEVLFSNDLWLLSYRTDFLIRIMPESLFNDLVMPLVLTLIVFFLTLGGILYFLKGRIAND